MLIRKGFGNLYVDRQTTKDSHNTKKTDYSFNQMGKWDDIQERKMTQFSEICQEILENVELRKQDDYLLPTLAERIKEIEKGRLVTYNKNRVVILLDQNKIIVPVQPGMSQAETIKKIFDSIILIKLEKYQQQINSQPQKENKFPASFTRVVSKFKDLIKGIGEGLSDSEETSELSSPRSEIASPRSDASSPREEPVSPLDTPSPIEPFSPRQFSPLRKPFLPIQEQSQTKLSLNKCSILTSMPKENLDYSPVAAFTPSPCSQTSTSYFSPNPNNYSPVNDFSPTMQYMNHSPYDQFLDSPAFSTDVSFNKLQFKKLIATRRQAMQSLSGQEVCIIKAVKGLKNNEYIWSKVDRNNRGESFLQFLQKDVAKQYPSYIFGKQALFLAVRTYIEQVIIEINQRLGYQLDVKSDDSYYDVNILRSYEKELIESINRYFPKHIREVEMNIREKIDKLWIRREMFIACQSQTEF